MSDPNHLFKRKRYDPNSMLKRSQYVSERIVVPEPIVVPTRNNNTPISFNSPPILKPTYNNNRKLYEPLPPRGVIRTRKNRKASRKNRKALRKNRKTRVNRR
jgi:hypothetical protein